MFITYDLEKAQNFLIHKGTANKTVTLGQQRGRKHSEHGLPLASGAGEQCGLIPIPSGPHQGRVDLRHLACSRGLSQSSLR